MSFAQPDWLFLGLLGLFVIVLHIRRRNVVEVSSLELFRTLVVSSKPQTAWRFPKLSLLLFLQLLAILLLTLALARPQFKATRVDAQHWIVLFDTSGSMQAKDGDSTRFEHALAELKKTINGLNASEQLFSMITIGSGIEVITARSQTLSDIEKAVAVLKVSAASSSEADWQKAADLVSGLSFEEESLRLMLFSDGAGAAVAEPILSTVFPETALELYGFGESASNAGLAEVQVNPVDLAKHQWKVAGIVKLFGDLSQLQLSVWFTPEGTEGALPWAEQVLKPIEGNASFEFDLELPSSGMLELRLADDALGFDNRRFIELKSEARIVRVLEVGPDNPPLQKALLSIEGLELSRSEDLPLRSSDYDLVILDRVQVNRHPGTNTLWLAGASLEGQSVSSLPNSSVTSWTTAHALATSVDWSALELNAAFDVPRLAGATVLLESFNNPLIQARTTGVGREVVLAFDLLNTSWINELGFPVFIANLLHWIAPWKGEVIGQTCRVGSACWLEPKSLYQGLSLVSETETIEFPAAFVTVTDTTAASEAWAPESLTTIFYPDTPGLYHLEPGGDLLSVYAYAGSESDLRLASSENSGQVSTASRYLWPLFRYLLFLALVVLLIEAYLAGRGADRFLQRRSLSSKNPLANRHRTVLGLRLVVLLIGLLALFGFSLLQPYREGHLLVIMDDGQLYSPEVQAKMANTLTKLNQVQGGWQKTILQLAAKPEIMPEFGSSNTTAVGADLAAALNLSAGLLGQESSGRVTVIASGTQTQGEVARVLSKLVARGVPVDVMPVGGIPAGEVFIESLVLPPQLYQGDSFVLQGKIYSGVAVPATLRIWRDGELYTEASIQLQAGLNQLDTPLHEETAGRFLYEYEVVADSDDFVLNNRGGIIADIQLTAKVLLVTPQTAWGEILADALKVQGVSVELKEPNQAPYLLKDILPYDTVILANVPAIDLHSIQQEVLESWVHDYGGGLLILGGENSFGPGGYYQTALERISPLSARVPQDAPKVAMMFILDRSGSMQQKVDNVSRLDIAKAATVSAVELLHPESLTGIVVFDTETHDLLPLQQVNVNVVKGALEPLQPGGGTALYWALVSAYEQMRLVDASTRHIVIMTDGLSQPGDFDSLSERIAAEGITVSTVAIGKGIDTSILQTIAKRGGGAFHATDDFRALPGILSQEALMLSSKPVEEAAFKPLWQNREASFLEGLAEELPPLYGFIQTTLKPEASLHLSGPEDMPIMASWRFGLGRVLAFTSQAAGSWSRDWIKDASYPLLWSQVVRWALPPVAKPGLHLNLGFVGDEISVAVRAIDEKGQEAAGLDPVAELKQQNEEGLERITNLNETESGHYEGQFSAVEPGRYQVRVTAAEPYSSIENEIYLSYPARFGLKQDADLLQALAAVTGGRVLFGDESLTPGRAPIRWRWLPAWPWLTLLAMCLLLLELTIRYAPGFFSSSLGKRPSFRQARS